MSKRACPQEVFANPVPGVARRRNDGCPLRRVLLLLAGTVNRALSFRRGGYRERATGNLADRTDVMGSAGGGELGRLLDEQVTYYRSLAGDYLNQALDLPGGEELTEALEAFRPAGSVPHSR